MHVVLVVATAAAHVGRIHAMNAMADREAEIFGAAVVLSPAQRATYLAEACAGTEELREHIEDLLRSHEAAGDFMGAPVVVPRPEAPPPELPGTCIGRYRLIEPIGEGGGGIVYLAEQVEPVRRRVALKVIKPGLDTAAVIARFEAERQALALMDHPNIARVFDAGATAQGRPFFVMELVRGTPLTQFCDHHRLPLRARLGLFVQVCQAIQHAHHKGVIHRDIKPSNILVTQLEGDRGAGCPKVIDFGIAKAIQPTPGDQPTATHFLAFIGTPAYTSPEQLERSGRDVDTRSDIYSLGVLLFELLTGRLPFDTGALVASGLEEMRRTFATVPPPRPSLCVRRIEPAARMALAARRATDAARWASMLRGDLDWIVLRCLEQDRSRRYSSASDLATDLERYLRHEPVSAVAPSLFYSLRKAARRHRVMFVSATLMLIVLAGAALSGTWLALRATRAEHAAAERLMAEQSARAEAEAQRQLAEQRLRAEARAREEAESQRRRSTDLQALAERRLVAELAARAEADRQRDTATAAARRAEAAEERAGQEADVQRAVSAFLREDLLEQASPLAQPDRELQVRTILDRASTRIVGKFAGQPEVEMAIRETLALTYSAVGDFAAMQRHLERALALGREQHGPANRGTLRLQSRLAQALHRQGAVAEAEALARETAEAQRQQFGDEDLDTLATRTNLALMRRSDGAGAETADRALLAALQRVAGPDDAGALALMNHLALRQIASGRVDAGVELLLQALTRQEKVRGEEHPDTLATLVHLAYGYTRQDRLAEAEAVYARTIGVQRRVLGHAHPDTLAAMAGYEDVLRRQHKNAKADAIGRERAAWRTIAGPEEP